MKNRTLILVMPMYRYPSICFLAVFLFCGLCLAGCGSPKLQGFSGSVTYDGQPLKIGIVTFIPDADKGNMMGKSTIAPIRDGRYELPPSQGISGGWYRMTVEVTELVEDEEGGSEKHVIPPYTLSHEFMPDDMTFDIEIPVRK